MAQQRTGPTLIQRSRAIGASEKASFHHVAGAGKSRVKRPFFDLTDSELDPIRDRIDQHLGKVIDSA